ncbi:thiopeptide-type bacteriocin biosynthesis protein [Streptomyces sp. NPDC005202]|uniref:thiopeptide-type bacteriocin biosynthesis protein n=1 Tax=Streptomyces sp. NPDC005202 TaxID=3157021 RepID=UPI0033B2AB15
MRNGPAQGGWRAFHIYLPHSLQTGFLCDVIGPLVRDTGGRDRFFFLRYWQGGPHIRLRIDGALEATLEAVRTSLASAVPQLTTELSDEYAYEVSLQSELADLEGEQPAEIRPAGTIEPADYVPEYRKYGGTVGVDIAERVFCETSVAVLDLLSAQADRELKAPIGEAMRIMAMSLRGSGLGVEESREFLGRYEAWWRRYVPPGYDDMWPSLYDRTRESVTNLCRSVWLEGRTDAFHDIYANALASAHSAHGEATDGDLAQLRLGDTTYAGCLANYLHTTNNRLGIIPAGEAFVAHVMRRSLAELKPS